VQAFGALGWVAGKNRRYNEHAFKKRAVALDKYRPARKPPASGMRDGSEGSHRRSAWPGQYGEALADRAGADEKRVRGCGNVRNWNKMCARASLSVRFAPSCE